MTIFSELAHEWHDGEQHVTDWFHRHARHVAETGQPGDTIAPNPHQPAQKGPAMSLKTLLDEGKTLLEDGESKVRQFLDEHVPQLAGLADLIESNPIFASVEGALHVPPEILNGFAKALDALAAQYPKPDAQAPAEVPIEPQSAG